MHKALLWLLSLLLVASCVPKEQVILRSIENVQIVSGKEANPILKGDARFFNPNHVRMKVKGIHMDILIDGKKSARIEQKLKSVIKPESDFTLPLEVQISLKEIGLFDALAGLFGGKKYELHYIGHIKVSVKGFPLKIPIDYKKEVKLRI